jgi:hypothetical protein
MVNNNLAVLFSPNIWPVPAVVTTVSIQKSVQTCTAMPFFNEKMLFRKGSEEFENFS